MGHAGESGLKGDGLDGFARGAEQVPRLRKAVFEDELIERHAALACEKAGEVAGAVAHLRGDGGHGELFMQVRLNIPDDVIEQGHSCRAVAKRTGVAQKRHEEAVYLRREGGFVKAAVRVEAVHDVVERTGELVRVRRSEHKAVLLLNRAAKGVGLRTVKVDVGERTRALEGARLEDLWLFMDAQETSSISPDMYRELVFPYYRQIMERFGLVSYGCCEPVHPIWDSCLSTVKNLRKVSISAWCDEEAMGERLRGTGITYLRKPPATIVGMPTALDEEAALACFRKTAKAAKGCKLEIAQREVYQVGGSAEKVHRYIELARIALDA